MFKWLKCAFVFLQQCLDDEDIADSDDESSGDEVFGITTIINLSNHKVYKYKCKCIA